jgi:hypothetical protein
MQIGGVLDNALPMRQSQWVDARGCCGWMLENRGAKLVP